MGCSIVIQHRNKEKILRKFVNALVPNDTIREDLNILTIKEDRRARIL